MKSLVYVFFAFSSIAFCQTRDPEQWIRQMLFDPPQMITGFELKHWPNLGDAAAPLISEVIGNAAPDEVVVNRMLGVIHTAFVRPATLPNVVDREPKATLVLLDDLAAAVRDASLKAKIAATRQYVLDQFAKSSAKDSPECLVGNLSTARVTESAASVRTFRVEEALQLLTENFDAKFYASRLRYAGDAAASGLNIVIGSCTLNTAEMQRALDLVRDSFGQPDLIRGASNREPKSTLILLDHLDRETQDPATKSMIADTRRFVLAQ